MGKANIDYKKQKQDARSVRSNSQSRSNRSNSSTSDDPYYKKKSKKKPEVLESMDEEQTSWMKGKLKSGSLFSDSECSSERNVNNISQSDSESEKPVPVTIVKQKQNVTNHKKKSTNVIKPPESSSESDSNKKRKKRVVSRKGVFSDSGESSSSQNSDSDSSSTSVKKDVRPQTSMLDSISKYITEPGCVSRAKQVVKKVLNERGNSHISIAFKGGKESTVLLHIVKCVIDEMQLPYDILDIVYFTPSENEIPMLREYIQSFVKSNKMSKCLKVVDADDLTEGLQEYVRASNINTMIIGIKSTDEGAKELQQTMQTQDIVLLNRVHPILSWGYKDVWDYINTNNIQTCELYKSGYTKIHTRNIITRNPILSDKKSNTFKSADQLDNPLKETWGVFDSFEGKVMKGGQRGRILMGVPTARVDTIPYGLDDGVYIGKARVNEVDKKYRKAIISISSRIDISGKHKRTVAVYISHKYTMDFYGKYMNIHVIGMLRKQQQYDNEIQLRNAMDVDIKYLESIVIDRDVYGI